jgi:hypothetical protein
VDFFDVFVGNSLFWAFAAFIAYDAHFALFKSSKPHAIYVATLEFSAGLLISIAKQQHIKNPKNRSLKLKE